MKCLNANCTFLMIMICFNCVLSTKVGFCQDWYKKATKSIQTNYQKASERLNNQYERTKTDAAKEYNETRNSTLKAVNGQINDSQNSLNKTINETSNNLGNFKSSLKQAVSEYRISDYEKKSTNYLTDVAVFGFKNFPIYDPEHQRLVSMDRYCRDIAKSMGVSTTDGDLGADPVRTAIMVMMDDNYLFHAKIIQDNDGRWISINDAHNMGIAADVVEGYDNTRGSYYSNNPNEFRKNFAEFMSSLEQYNSNSSNYKHVVITLARSYFYSYPDLNSRLNSFCIKGDVLEVLERNGNWYNVRYIGKVKTTIGWMNGQNFLFLKN